MRARYPFIERDDGVILVLRARDVERLITDQRTRRSKPSCCAPRASARAGHGSRFQQPALLQWRDPPTPAPAAVARLRLPDDGGAAADCPVAGRALIDEKRDSGLLKLRDEFAALVPAITIAAILGIPRADVPVFTALSYRVSKILTSSWTREDLPDIEQATQDLTLYIEALIQDRRRHPCSDFLSDYVETVDRAGAISALEAVMQIVSVVLGGSDTTRAAIVVMAGCLLSAASGRRCVASPRSSVRSCRNRCVASRPSARCRG